MMEYFKNVPGAISQTLLNEIQERFYDLATSKKNWMKNSKYSTKEEEILR